MSAKDFRSAPAPNTITSRPMVGERRHRSMKDSRPRTRPDSSSRLSITSTARRSRRSTGVGTSVTRAAAGCIACSSTTSSERDNDQYSFKSIEAEVVQLVPIMRANWVIALRGLATVTDLEDSGSVPYFLLPSLGGGSTLRGYPDFRFQDRNRLLMTAELRWTPARFLDMAIFYDTGKVASRREDLDFDDLKDSYGIGMRLIGVRGYAFRIEAARSRENNLRLLVGAGGAF